MTEVKAPTSSRAMRMDRKEAPQISPSRISWAQAAVETDFCSMAVMAVLTPSGAGRAIRFLRDQARCSPRILA